ncbi:MAG: heavy-metal-associated domain-containing protein [Flavobacteriaceae bacterium]|nr:heavy-metal-associated domain-containing protein [Flavobacteriaceae bacterium]MDG1980534.1 heavy-metal-associated domain-containing protein [Flavobacteriaceae bacterium]MDG2444995.1 heavy-metal-associated domain-containing protein [Flavobacteriaceae bacterium]
MKNIILSFIFLMAISLTSCSNKSKNQTSTTSEVSKEITPKEISFGVRGNCGMCKTTIEKAATNLDGVSSASWNVDQKTIVVSYDSSSMNEMSIHDAIAASGYDTEKVLGNLDAYNSLPGCCQYDHEMEMNQGTKTE